MDDPAWRNKFEWKARLEERLSFLETARYRQERQMLSIQLDIEWIKGLLATAQRELAEIEEKAA